MDHRVAMTGDPMRIEVSTTDVARLALDLRNVADRVADTRHQAEALMWRPRTPDALRASVNRILACERDIREAAETTARVGMSYLQHDVSARAAFLHAWFGVPRPAHLSGVWPGLSLVAGPVPGALTAAGLWAATGLSAWATFARPTAGTVWSLRTLATLLGESVAVGNGTQRSGIRNPAPTGTLAHDMLTLLPDQASRGSVVAQRLSQSSERSPQGFADLVSRIPSASATGPQVRIDRMGTTAVVYIGGTVSGDLNGGSQPWDMRSNIAALGGTQSDAERGVRDAIRRAGVSSADRIIVVGHSQGGLIAQRLAADASLHVTDVVTVGSPVQAQGIPSNVRVITVENSNDPIPALGGLPDLDSRDVSVRRVDDIPAEGDGLAAHHVQTYVDTARAMDASGSGVLRSQRDALFADLPENGTTTTWRASRTP